MLPHTPTQFYLVWIRFWRKISFVTSFTISKWLKKYYFRTYSDVYTPTAKATPHPLILEKLLMNGLYLDMLDDNRIRYSCKICAFSSDIRDNLSLHLKGWFISFHDLSLNLSVYLSHIYLSHLFIICDLSFLYLINFIKCFSKVKLLSFGIFLSVRGYHENLEKV